MNGCTDLDINCQVRKVLVHHWIDLGKVSIRTTRGVVQLSGELRKLYNAKDELNTQLVLTILSEIRRIRNARRVTTDFNNWVCKDGMWQMTLSGVLSAQLAPVSAGSAKPETDQVFDVEAELPDEEQIKKHLVAPTPDKPAGL